MIKTVATVSNIERKPTRTGGTMGLITADGKTYQTFDLGTIESAEKLNGRTVIIGYDERKNGQYTNRVIKLFAVADGEQPKSDSSHQNGVTTGPEEAVPNLGGANGDWYTLISNAASSGDWRAADALLKRRDINRSVALNNSIKFLEFLQEKDRTPTNVRLIFESLLDILAN